MANKYNHLAICLLTCIEFNDHVYINLQIQKSVVNLTSKNAVSLKKNMTEEALAIIYYESDSETRDGNHGQLWSIMVVIIGYSNLNGQL
ncbi:unnamed protein product [Rhizophagus irregularis]|nr:unnamed protein product [Rhizophagus irregularis]CAB4417784.1 unnamed protein product [Rhizophagus irregularis]